MCGIAGYSNIPTGYRYRLAQALGMLLDKRGGHGAGFFSIGNPQSDNAASSVKLGKTEKTWTKAGPRLIGQCNAPIVAMHSRFATCGGRGPESAHPFKLTDDNGGLIVGMHNGVIRNAESHSRERNRPYDSANTVDSYELIREVFASGTAGELSGYGTLVFYRDNVRGVQLVRLSHGSDLEIALVSFPGHGPGKGVVWGSTREIVQNACDISGIAIETFYEIKVGSVHEVLEDKVLVTTREIKLSADTGRTYSRVSSHVEAPWWSNSPPKNTSDPMRDTYDDPWGVSEEERNAAKRTGGPTLWYQWCMRGIRPRRWTPIDFDHYYDQTTQNDTDHWTKAIMRKNAVIDDCDTGTVTRKFIPGSNLPWSADVAGESDAEGSTDPLAGTESTDDTGDTDDAYSTADILRSFIETSNAGDTFKNMLFKYLPASHGELSNVTEDMWRQLSDYQCEELFDAWIADKEADDFDGSELDIPDAETEPAIPVSRSVFM